MARISTFNRYIGGVVVSPYGVARRTIPTAGATGTGSLKSYVTSTTALTTNEWNVARAFWILFGRAPERSSLAYWAGQAYANNFVNTINGIVAAIAGSYVLDTDPGVSITRFYYNIFGKYESEDAEGIGYWASRVSSGETLGAITELILSISAAASGFSADSMRNRQLALESVCRLQAAHSRDLEYQDSRSLALAPDGTLAAYDATMAKLYTLLVSGTPTPSTIAWADAWTSGSLYTFSRLPDNNTIRQLRNVVWYNRNGEAMLANLYLPAGFEASAGTRCVMATHGGGWRVGAPYQLDWFCTALAAGTEADFVVLAPTYRLSAYGHSTPAQEEDIIDFVTLIRASAFLKGDMSKVGLFGESSGAHLNMLAGCFQNEWRVLALYPPTDLRGSPSVSTGLQPYSDYYASDATAKQNASPAYTWSAARTTHFNLWHGSADTFVPPAQSSSFHALVGAVKSSYTLKTGEGHGFTASAKAEVIAEAKTYFSA